MRSLVQKAQEETKWCYISGLIKSVEKDLISASQYQSFLSVKTQSELLRSLGDSYYKKIFRQEEDLFNYEKMLKTEVTEKLDLIKKYSPQPLVYDYFKVRIDIQELKTKIKSYLSGTTQDAEINEQRLEEEIFRKNVIDGFELSSEYYEAYKNIIKTYKEKRFLQAVDFEADRQMLDILSKMAEASENELIKKYTFTFIELKNLTALWRLRSMRKPVDMLSDILFIPQSSGLTMNDLKVLYGLPYHEWPAILSKDGYQDIWSIEKGNPEETSSFTEIEKKSDDFLTDILRRTKYIPFGAEVVFAYMAGFFLEVLNIKIIIIANLNQLAEAMIKTKVRQVYV